MGIVGTHPGSFRKSGKQRSCGIWNLEEDTEDGRQGECWKERVGELNAETQSSQGGRFRYGLAVPVAQAALGKVSSINHNPCWHKLHSLSSTFIVLVFSKLESFVRKILQREENKGVELTVWRERKLEGRN